MLLESSFTWDAHVDVVGFAMFWILLRQQSRDEVACVTTLGNLNYSLDLFRTVEMRCRRTILGVAQLQHQFVGNLGVLIDVEVSLAQS
jgi:hypothetical protein